ncbi:F-box only protein 6 [Frankliniella fusca]|uniref:F-box only protein 6 n=1 Tax=Frankliniella fusca TaxID=407009 RepID=A0AAE1H4R9_9NEOP|nr:F-box only protein 6 [Frankliniella fusca]
MGAIYGKEETPRENIREVEPDPNNGLIFNEFYLPPEVVAHILTYLHPILNGRRVCKVWQDMIDSVVWREKVLREVPGATISIFQHKDLMWTDYYFLWKHKPHLRNLIRNGAAEERFDHWAVRSNHIFGENVRNRWKIEKEPVGCDPFPPGVKRCFVTTYEWCTAEQVINLHEFGLTSNFMKHVCPNIHVEEWYAGRFDCGFEYCLKVTLLNSQWEEVDSFVFETTGHTTAWTKVEHVFSNYNKEVSIIVFHHKGKDTQFWAGHYGCKITGAKVYVTLPGLEDKTTDKM